MTATTAPRRTRRPGTRPPGTGRAGAGAGESAVESAGHRAERTYQAVKLTRPARLRLRMWAGFLDRELSELVEEAITAHLDQLDRERRRRGLSPLPLPDA